MRTFHLERTQLVAAPLAEARVALLHVPLEHFLTTPEGRAAADRWLT